MNVTGTVTWGVGTAYTSPGVVPKKPSGSVRGFSSGVPSAFWSMGAPVWSPRVGSTESTVTDQPVSVPVLLDWVSSMVKV